MACLSQGGQDDQIRGLSARESDIELVCALSFDRFGDKERRLRRIRWIDTTGYVRTMAESRLFARTPMDGSGILYIADTMDNAIRRIR